MTGVAIARSAAASVPQGNSDENTTEDLELALATRPRRKLTPDEKVQRRRLQYKLHQRRHRAKQKDLTLDLEKEVCQLAERVASLQEKRQILMSRSVFESRSTLVGAPARVAMEYLRMFEYGYAQQHGIAQAEFLRSVMAEDVAGPDFEGVDVVIEQWQLYAQVFLRTQFLPDVVDVSVAGDMTVVAIPVVLIIRARRDGLMSLYPNLQGDEEVIQALVGSPICVSGKVRLVFDRSGVCTWLGHEMDFVSGLQRTLGSLEKVAYCMQDAQISLCTGQITPTRHSPKHQGSRYGPPARHGADYHLV